jgi:transposase InsO family protein
MPSERRLALRGGRAAIEGVVFHSDRGCQYTAEVSRQACEQLGITQSMGSVGDCLLTG